MVNGNNIKNNIKNDNKLDNKLDKNKNNYLKYNVFDDDLLTFGEEDFIIADPFMRDLNNGIDGDYLISLMPKTEKQNKLELLEELYYQFCSIATSQAEKGEKSCTFDVTDIYHGYGTFDSKEIAKLLYKKITSKPGITGYAEELKLNLTRLYLTWFSSKEVERRSPRNKSLNSKSIQNISPILNKSLISNQSISSKKSTFSSGKSTLSKTSNTLKTSPKSINQSDKINSKNADNSIKKLSSKQQDPNNLLKKNLSINGKMEDFSDNKILLNSKNVSFRNI